MPFSVERKSKPEVPEGVREPPEAPELPAHIEKGGVKVQPTQFTAQVYDDKGKPLIQTPATKTVTVQLPADQTALASWSKGSISDSLTWLAMFWLRIIKKALHFGWKIVRKEGGK
jgi:hypothetical protein